ncbi:ABC transporter ATP-binding protein [Pseudonocardia benzenivorans]|uniref:Xenobiotic-transporting ATPase n=2 Tax=Pseudonocardia TaxID=1847 RepID=F4CNR4_PSEUX|nr:ABC transporter ATP-binding protein [Pseudonocardia dioxanivorans]AEA22526.1 Xenobiotic-transporting ATPase [Pseudonocardia dioxanivorans CB1190]GJF01359.1 ABC transporter permease [Pseudonocardia sp. D17]
MTAVTETVATPDRRTLLPVAGARESWSWLAGELRHHRALAALTLFVGIVAAAAAVLPSYVFAALVDGVRDRGPTSTIVMISVVLVVAAVVGGVLSGVAAYLTSKLGESVLATMRERVVARALTLPTPVLEKAGKGDLLSRIGDDVNTIGRAVTDVLPKVISSLLIAVLGLVAMAGLDWRLGLAGLVAVPFYLVALRWYLRRSAPLYAQERKAVGARSQALMESMIGARTVHAYRLERPHLAEIDAAAIRARDLSIGIVTLFTRFVGRTNRAEFVGLSVVLVIGFVLVRADVATVGAATAAALLFHRLFDPVGTALHSFDEVQSAGACLARLVGVVRIPDDTRAGAQPGGTPADASLELVDIAFGYEPGAPVLHGVTLRIEPGERLALVGSTGAGKTTLAAIAAGQLVPDRGVVRLGGIDLAALTPEQVRAQVAIVSQEVHVFAGPLADDVRLARPDATDEEVRDALARVGALEWVDALPDGIATEVGEGGRELTAAQAQQLALARLVICDPPVAILDEATAEAGSLGARGLEQAAAAATAGRTTIVVAHRLTQAATADRIVVMEDGRVVESGTHCDLLAHDGRYAQLWTAWRSQAVDVVPAAPGTAHVPDA